MVGMLTVAASEVARDWASTATHTDELTSMSAEHTKEFHESLKQLPEWELLAYLGEQVLPPWEGEPEEVLEMRNCTCGSTLAKKVR